MASRLSFSSENVEVAPSTSMKVAMTLALPESPEVVASSFLCPEPEASAKKEARRWASETN
jgi:hypothetical protein